MESGGGQGLSGRLRWTNSKASVEKLEKTRKYLAQSWPRKWYQSQYMVNMEDFNKKEQSNEIIKIRINITSGSKPVNYLLCYYYIHYVYWLFTGCMRYTNEES